MREIDNVLCDHTGNEAAGISWCHLIHPFIFLSKLSFSVRSFTVAFSDILCSFWIPHPFLPLMALPCDSPCVFVLSKSFPELYFCLSLSWHICPIFSLAIFKFYMKIFEPMGIDFFVHDKRYGSALFFCMCIVSFPTTVGQWNHLSPNMYFWHFCGYVGLVFESFIQFHWSLWTFGCLDQAETLPTTGRSDDQAVL